MRVLWVKSNGKREERGGEGRGVVF